MSTFAATGWPTASIPDEPLVGDHPELLEQYQGLLSRKSSNSDSPGPYDNLPEGAQALVGLPQRAVRQMSLRELRHRVLHMMKRCRGVGELAAVGEQYAERGLLGWKALAEHIHAELRSVPSAISDSEFLESGNLIRTGQIFGTRPSPWGGEIRAERSTGEYFTVGDGGYNRIAQGNLVTFPSKEAAVRLGYRRVSRPTSHVNWNRFCMESLAIAAFVGLASVIQPHWSLIMFGLGTLIIVLGWIYRFAERGANEFEWLETLDGDGARCARRYFFGVQDRTPHSIEDQFIEREFELAMAARLPVIPLLQRVAQGERAQPVVDYQLR